MKRTPRSEMLAYRQQYSVLGFVAAAKNREHPVAVTLTRTESAARRNQLVNDGNHEPLVGNSRLVNLRASVLATVCDSSQLARADLQHVDRTVRQCDEQISGAGEQPNRKLRRKKPTPLLQERRPIQARPVNQIVVNVHGARRCLTTRMTYRR